MRVCTRVISTHCAAVSCYIKKRAILSHCGEPREKRNRKYAPCTRDRCSFRECFLILVHVGTRARVYCRAERTGSRQRAFFPFPFSPCMRAGFTFLPSHEEPDSLAQSLGVCGFHYTVGPSSTRR